MSAKVFLTIGRHGYYNYGSRFPLLESSIIDSLYRGKNLAKDFGKPDALYSSKIARAAATANLRAIGAEYSRDKIVFENALHEDAQRNQIEFFLEVLRAEAQLYEYRHIHIVTHAPVIEKILAVLTHEMCFVSPGNCVVLEANNWDEIYQRKAVLKALADYYPGFGLLFDLWREKPDRQSLQQYFSGNDKANIVWTDAFRLLELGNRLSGCQSIEDVYSLLDNKASSQNI